MSREKLEMMNEPARPAATDSERFIIAALFGIFAFVLATPVEEYDFFWHLASGRWIWENGALPTQDPFSYTSGEPDGRDAFILRGYWLAQLIYYFLWSLAGPTGIVLLRVGILTATAHFIYRSLRDRGLAPSWSVLAVAPFLFDIRLRLFIGDRPQQWTFLFVAMLFHLLETLRRRERLRVDIRTVGLPLLMIVWANLHGGFVLGNVIIALYCIGLVLDTVRSGQRVSAVMPFLGLCVVAGISSLLNPSHAAAALTILDNPTALYGSAPTEARSLRDMLALGWRPWGYFVACALGATAVLTSLRRFSIAHLLILVFLFYISQAKIRFVIFFVLAAVQFGVPYLKERFNELSRLAMVQRGVLGTAVLASLMLVYGSLARGHVVGVGLVDQSLYPPEAVRYINEQHLPQRLLNPYEWGGYLMVYLPDYKGRGMRANDDRMVLEYDSLLGASGFSVRGEPEWKYVLKANDISTVLMHRRNVVNGEPIPLNAALRQDPQWKLEFEDDRSFVFVRDDAPALDSRAEAGSASPREEAPPGAAPSQRRVMVPPLVAASWKAVVLEVEDKRDGSKRDFTVAIGNSLMIGRLDVKVVYFLPAFAMGPGYITSSSNEPVNPAAGIEVREDRQTIFANAIFSRFPEMHPFQHDHWAIRLKNFVRN
jgi:hypothetical protein